MQDDLAQLDLVATVPGTEAVVEIQSRPTGQVLYVHFVDRTVLRICRLAKVTVKGLEDVDSKDV